MLKAGLLVGSLVFSVLPAAGQVWPDSAVGLPLLLPHQSRNCVGAEFLRDLDTLYLAVITSVNARIQGLDRRALAARIERELVREGIAVEGSYGYDREALGDGELPLLGAWMGGKRPLPPMLVVEVNAVPLEEGRFVYLVEAALRQLLEDRAAGVWRARDIGVVASGELADVVLMRADKLMEQFVEEHYCANLPRPVK